MRNLPRILVIDDILGRSLPEGNRERMNMCEAFSLRDVSPDSITNHTSRREKNNSSANGNSHKFVSFDANLKAVADVVFCRGQTPQKSKLSGTVENDLQGVIETIKNGWEAVRLQPGECPWSLILVDMLFLTGRVTEESQSNNGTGMPEGRWASRYPDGDDNPKHYFGLKILEALKSGTSGISNLNELPVVVLSSMSPKELEGPTEELLVRAFLPRTAPDSPQRLKELLERYKLVPDVKNGIIGASKPLLLALRKARWAAEGKQDILILGETGTGKNLLARAIHNNSNRKNGPFKEVNCAAISRELIESELFGHIKGAFTGALSDKKGFFLATNGGTLLIDEVGDMPEDVQVKLLSALESRRVTPVGSTESIPFDTRIITATNAPLEKLCAERKFRTDLYYRIRPLLIQVPALRERASDIPRLVDHIIESSGYPSRVLQDAAREILCAYPWPGNYRELKFCIEQVLNEYPEAKTIQPGHLRGLGHAQTPELPKQIDNVQASLKPLGSMLANLIETSFEQTRQPTPKDPDGRSIARAMALLEGRAETLSGPLPARTLKRLLKTVHLMNPEALVPFEQDSFYTPFLPSTSKEKE